MTTQDLSKDVLEQLECPVCLEYMLPPIILCGNGHNICSSCKPKLPSCPTCRETFSQARNKALEKLALKVESPCRNKVNGCTLTFPVTLIREHQEVCEYNPFECLLHKYVHCKWTGPFRAIKQHLTQKHRNWVTDMSAMTQVLIKNFNKNKTYFRIILLNDDIFQQQFEVIEGAFYYVIKYVGTEDRASGFKYKFKLEKDFQKVSVCNIVSSCDVNVLEVYDTGKCVKLYYETLERFLDENNSFKFCFEISKV
jgi:E3 ubiquitin-protein ligase SIAH1